MKLLKTLGKILLRVAVGVAALLVLLWVGVTLVYFPYFSNAKAEFFIPGLNDGFVPQGFDYLTEQDTYLIGGYMADHSASRIYVRDGAGKTRYVQLQRADGSAYDKHMGGVCHNGDFLYIPDEGGVDVFRLSDVMTLEDPKQLGTLEIGHRTDYCTFYNDYLLVGSFYYEGTYETPEEHRITTPAGDANTSLLLAFKADADGTFGIDPVPVAAFSTPDKVQGICFTSDEEAVLSTSYSISSSKLFFHKIDKSRVGEITVLGEELPLYYMDSDTLTKTVSAPPMSEELVFKDGRVFVMCESACNKYFFGKLIRGYRVFAYEV